jgi:hypothetical protein
MDEALEKTDCWKWKTRTRMAASSTTTTRLKNDVAKGNAEGLVEGQRADRER